MPLVLLAIAPAGTLFDSGEGLTTGNYAPVPDIEIQTPLPIVYIRPGQFGFIGRTKNDFKVFPMHDHLESFRYDYLMWSGTPSFTIQMFDPEFDRLLGYFTAARNSARKYSLYVRFGWGVDGTSGEKFSPTYETTVVGIQSVVVPGGMRITVQAIPEQSLPVRTARLKTAVSIPAGLPPEQIAKYLIELNYVKFVGVTSADRLRTLDGVQESLDAEDIARNATTVKTTTPRLEIDPDATCEPIQNNGQPALILPAGMTAYGFIRDVLIPRAVPKDSNRSTEAVYCYEASPGVFRWSLYNGKDVRKRRYDVGRGASHQVISFQPRESAWLANVLGGDGVVAGVDGSKSKASQSVENRQGPLAGPDNSQRELSGNAIDSNSRFYRHSADRTFETLVQKQRARWNQMKNVVIQAEMTIVGDPGIEILETVDVRVIAGGTTNTVGRYSEADGEQERGAPSVVPYMSGGYSVLGYGHQIDMTGYQTSLLLVFQQEKSDDAAQTDEDNLPNSQIEVAPETVLTVQKSADVAAGEGAQ